MAEREAEAKPTPEDAVRESARVAACSAAACEAPSEGWQ
jgi:hypothetical protein